MAKRDKSTMDFNGRLTKDPELRYNNEGKPRAFFTVACGDGEYNGQPNTDFYFVVVYGTQAENAAKYLQKGRLVNVVGRLKIETKQVGDKYETNAFIRAREVHYLDFANNQGDSNSNQGTSTSPTDTNTVPNYDAPIDISDDDLPF